MAFFDPSEWTGKIYSDGWRDGSAGTMEVIEPATGRSIGSVGLADAADVGRAVESAAKAQKAWAALPYTERAAALRRAATLIEEHAGELSDWLVRETGSGKGKAGFEASLVSAE